MGVDKAPGPDGFSIRLFITFWDFTRIEVMNLLHELWLGRTRLNKVNYLLITPVPKNNTSKSVGDFRPIALLNSSLKIISKILANRLAPKLWSLINNYQTGFVSSRNILDGVAIAQKVSRQGKKFGRKGFFLKFNF